MANLVSAKNLIAKLAGEIIKESSVYETAPWGNTDQDNFLNQALLVDTKLTPPDLLKCLLDIEKKMGRERIEKWGPRLIDIDILYYNVDVLYKDDLKIPHPYMQDRRFALVALNELSPEWIHPLLHKTAAQMLEECKDNGWVKTYAPAN